MSESQGSTGSSGSNGAGSQGATQNSQPSSLGSTTVHSKDSNPNGKSEGTGKAKDVAAGEKKEPVIIRKRKLKDDYTGKEYELTDAEIERDWRLRKYSDQIMNDAKKLRQQSETFVDLLKTNPAKVLSDPRIGVDLRKFCEDYLSGDLEREMMDPKDREIAELKKILQEREESEKQKEMSAEQAKQAELAEHWKNNYKKEIEETLSSSGLPKTPYTMKRMAHYMHLSMQHNKPLSPKDVVAWVKADYQEEMQAIFGALDGDNLDAFVGPDIGKKIRNNDIAKLKTKPQEFNKKPETVEPNRVKHKTLSQYDWKQKMQRIKQGLE